MFPLLRGEVGASSDWRGELHEGQIFFKVMISQFPSEPLTDSIAEGKFSRGEIGSGDKEVSA